MEIIGNRRKRLLFLRVFSSTIHQPKQKIPRQKLIIKITSLVCFFYCKLIGLLVFSVSEVVSSDDTMLQPLVWIVPSDLQIGRGQPCDAYVFRRPSWLLAIRDELKFIGSGQWGHSLTTLIRAGGQVDKNLYSCMSQNNRRSLKNFCTFSIKLLNRQLHQ